MKGMVVYQASLTRASSLVNALNAAGISSSSPLIDLDPFTIAILVSALPVIDYPSADK